MEMNMFYTWQSDEKQVPGGGGYLTYTITPSSGWQIIFVGWQNDGNATDLCASQIFIEENGAEAFIQLVNTSFTPTNTWAWIVLAPLAGTADSAKPTATATGTEGKK